MSHLLGAIYIYVEGYPKYFQCSFAQLDGEKTNQSQIELFKFGRL